MLEADWAATLDALRIAWSYEPEAVRLPSGDLYRPDFWLPEITTWLEVKGPHDERIGKARELAQATEHHTDCENLNTGLDDYTCCQHGWGNPFQFVVIGRAPLGGVTTFEWPGGPEENLVLQECSGCGTHYWLDEWGAWDCRRHAAGQGGSEHRNGAMYLSPSSPKGGAWTHLDHFPFQRALR